MLQYALFEVTQTSVVMLHVSNASSMFTSFYIQLITWALTNESNGEELTCLQCKFGPKKKRCFVL